MCQFGNKEKKEIIRIISRIITYSKLLAVITVIALLCIVIHNLITMS